MGLRRANVQSPRVYQPMRRFMAGITQYAQVCKLNVIYLTVDHVMDLQLFLTAADPTPFMGPLPLLSP